MSNAVNTTNIKVMDREFTIKCPPENVAELQQAAKYLEDKMQAIYQGHKSVGTDRIAVVAALNISNELLSLAKRIANLKTKIAEIY